MAKLCLAFRGRPIQAHHFEENAEATIGNDPGCTIVIDSLAVAPQHAKIITTKYNCRLISLNEAFPTLVNHNAITERYLTHGDIVQIGKHTLTFAEDEQAVGLMPTLPPSTPKNNCGQRKSEHLVTRDNKNTFNPSVTGAASSPSNLPEQSRFHLLNLPPDTLEPATDSNQKHNPHTMTQGEIAALEQSLHCESCVQIVNGKHFGKVIPMDHGLVRLGNIGQTTATIAHRRDGYFLSHLEGNIPPKVNSQSIGKQSHQLFDGDTIRIGNTRMIFHLHGSPAQTRITAIKEA